MSSKKTQKGLIVVAMFGKTATYGKNQGAPCCLFACLLAAFKQRLV